MIRTHANRIEKYSGLAAAGGGLSRPGRRLAALAIAAACTSAAFAGGTARCRIVLTPTLEGQRVEANGATGLGSAATAGPLGYCPGGFASGPRKHGGDLGQADGQAAKAVSAQELNADALDDSGLDALDAALIAKSQFASDATRTRSVKLEAMTAEEVEQAVLIWKVELQTPDKTIWCIVLDAQSGALVSKSGRAQDGTPVSDGEIEDLALKNPEAADGTEQDPSGATPIEDVDTQPVDGVAGIVKGDEMDMFKAIDWVANHINDAERNPPSPVPAQKITDRPQPKHGPSTGSRW